MATPWQPFSEPLGETLKRNLAIAVVVGTVFAASGGGWNRWPMATLAALWPSLGGHCVEIFFLNWLRPKIPDGRGPQVLARLAVWFVAGLGFAVCMTVTAEALSGFRLRQPPAWWLGGVAFIGVELVAHLGPALSRRPSFYDGRG